MDNKMGKIIYFLLLSFTLTSCEDSEFPTVNHSPTSPADPFPANGSLNISTAPLLSWSPSYDHEWDSLTYDVYFDTIDDPTKIILSDVTSTRHTLSSLLNNKQYYWKICVKESNGRKKFGPVWCFTTIATQAPTILTWFPTNIDTTSATCGGMIISDGGSSINERGVCWNTLPNPTYETNHLSVGTTADTFTIKVSGLTKNTTYYLKAYARYAENMSYSDEIVFKTPSASVIDIDGNVYQAIQIGTQVWMAENLKTTRYRNGNAIANVTDNTVWSNMTTGAYCNYSNDTNNLSTYGFLYNWYTVNDSRNIAPTGWHVPTTNDLQILINYLGGSSIAGGKMKEAGTTHWAPPNTGADNSSGFTSLPSGFRRGNDGVFLSKALACCYWSTEEFDNIYAYCRSNTWDDAGAFSGYAMKINGYSIRCVKD